MTDMSQLFSGTKEVDERFRFDEGALETYMRENVDGFRGNLEVRQFKGGQSNPTYALRAGGKEYVLRRKPPGKLLPSAHAVDREYKVLTALGTHTDVPVAKTWCMCDDENVIGTIFYVMDLVDGRVIWDQSLADVPRNERAKYYDAMNDVVARLHNVDYQAVGLADFGKPGDYVARQISRWSKQYKLSETDRIEEMDRLMEWLPENAPETDETSVIHGDYRMDNMIFHPTEPRVVAVLDWELSTLGDPLADFAYHVMSWRLPPQLFRGIGGLDLDALGIPQEEAYVAAYCRRTGRESIGNWDYYLAYNMFRIAAILQGIAGRVRDGTAASDHANDQVARIRPLAEWAWKQAEKVIAAK
ncbi:MAG: phosphotransferase family protein [Pseudomonadota bacterium]|nr:phosphotransferase family protein [Pseudomonadota bacterium]